MKNKILRSLLALSLTLFTLPVVSQDYMNVFFKNGDFRKFYLKNVKEIATSKFDVNGVQHGDYEYQHVTTIYDKYVYALSDVDSITFTKIDEELAEQNFASAMSVVFPIISNCSTIGDAEKNIEQIKHAEGVAEAWCDGHQLYIAIKEGEVFSFHFNHDFSYNSEMEKIVSQIRAKVPQMKSVVKRDGARLKAVIANQQHKDENRSENIKDFFEPLKTHFELCNVDVDYIEEPTVEFFDSQIYEYDIVFLITHGGYASTYTAYYDWFHLEWRMEMDGIKCHSFQTSEDIDFTESASIEAQDSPYWNDKYKKFKKWRNKTTWKDATDKHIEFGFAHEIREGKVYWVTHPSLTELFFRDISRGSFKNPNSIFFNAACQSLMGENGEPSYSLADEFFKKNLGVYIGYDETNWSGQQNGYYFFKSMLNGNSFRKAIDDIWIVKEEDNEADLDGDGKEEIWTTHFLYKTNPYTTFEGDMFLTPTYTEERALDELLAEYKLNHYVDVEGVTTFLEEGNVTMGFEYGTDENNLSTKSFADIIPSIIETPYAPNYGKGNVRFKGTLYELEPGNTYYYRAFTWDGFNYNKGNIEQFTVFDAVVLSEASITLQLGNVGNIRIFSGSGSYEATSSNPEVATASISDLREGNAILLIQPHKAGSATITVTDIKSGYSATIEVTVTSGEPIDVPEGCVDLGLPSGTLWATYNVGANAPEEYGGYYAWGEVEEKSSYSTSNYSLSSSITELTADKDVATVMWGDKWRMPTMDEINELLNECSWSWEEYKGVMGARVTGTNGQSIFLPAGGFKDANDSYAPAPGVYGSYWGRTHNSSYGTELVFGIGDYKNYYKIVDFYYELGPWGVRSAGRSVRPVYAERHIDGNDYTIFITNPTFDNNIYGGWQGTQLSGYNPDNNAEHYNKSYDTYQTISGLPAGRYQLGVQGFYRKGSATNDYELWSNDDTANNNAVIYATSSVGSYSKPFVQPSSAALATSLGGKTATVGNGLYIPDDMVAAGVWFAAGHYHNYLEVEVGNDGKLIIGIKKDTTISGDWTIIDNWTLIKL